MRRRLNPGQSSFVFDYIQRPLTFLEGRLCANFLTEDYDQPIGGGRVADVLTAITVGSARMFR